VSNDTRQVGLGRSESEVHLDLSPLPVRALVESPGGVTRSRRSRCCRPPVLVRAFSALSSQPERFAVPEGTSLLPLSRFTRVASPPSPACLSTPRHHRSAAVRADGPHRRLPVPSSWFPTTSTASSTHASAGLLHPASGPEVRHVFSFPRPARPESPAGRRSPAPCALHPSKNPPHPQPVRVTTACCLLAVSPRHGRTGRRRSTRRHAASVPGSAEADPTRTPHDDHSAANRPALLVPCLMASAPMKLRSTPRRSEARTPTSSGPTRTPERANHTGRSVFPSSRSRQLRARLPEEPRTPRLSHLAMRTRHPSPTRHIGKRASHLPGRDPSRYTLDTLGPCLAARRRRGRRESHRCLAPPDAAVSRHAIQGRTGREADFKAFLHG